MLIRTFTVLAFLFLGNSSFAQMKALYYFGGGGETGTAGIMFDSSMREIPSFAKRGWKIYPWYAGPTNAASKTLAENAFDYKVPHFTVKNFKLALTQVSQTINAMSGIKGEQILIVIDTHGEGYSKSTKYHFVHASDGTVDLAALDPLIQKAILKNIKIAVIDMSCFGGITLESLPNGACGVSLSRPTRTAFNYDPNIFYQSIYPQGYSDLKNDIERVFVRARPKMLLSLAEPGITTTAGKMTSRALSPFLTGLMNITNLSTASDHPKWSGNVSIENIDFPQMKLVIGSLILAEKNKLKTPKIWDRFNKKLQADNNYLTDRILKLEGLQAQVDYSLRQLQALRATIDPLALVSIDVAYNGWIYTFSGTTVLEHILYNDWQGLAKQVGRKNANWLYSKYSNVSKDQIEDLQKFSKGLLSIERQLYTEFYGWTSESLQQTGGAEPCAEFEL